MGLRQPTPLPEYDLQRQKLKDTLREQGDTQRTALERRFAQLQGGPSGAQIKMGNEMEQQLGQQRQAGENDINIQEAAARRQMDEAQKQREFQTSERVAGQGFAGEQANLQRGFTTSERLGSQGFATGERQGSQQFAGSESQKARELQQEQFGKSFGLQKQVAENDQSNKLRQLDQVDREYKSDQASTEFNKVTSIMGGSDYRAKVGGLISIINDPQNSQAMRDLATQYYKGLLNQNLGAVR